MSLASVAANVSYRAVASQDGRRALSDLDVDNKR